MIYLDKDSFNHLIGKRIQLLKTDDPYTNLAPFDLGTISHIDDIGTIFVNWDNGSLLGLIPGRDQYKVIYD
jgi:hypothetical protein